MSLIKNEKVSNNDSVSSKPSVEFARRSSVMSNTKASNGDMISKQMKNELKLHQLEGIVKQHQYETKQFETQSAAYKTEINDLREELKKLKLKYNTVMDQVLYLYI